MKLKRGVFKKMMEGKIEILENTIKDMNLKMESLEKMLLRHLLDSSNTYQHRTSGEIEDMTKKMIQIDPQWFPNVEWKLNDKYYEFGTNTMKNRIPFKIRDELNVGL